MKRWAIAVTLFVCVSLIFSPTAHAFVWVYMTTSTKGTVIDAFNGKPVAGATICYDIYRGVGRMYRSSYKVFQHVESTTNEKGEYFLPGVIKPFWLVEPKLILANCIMPGLGMHTGFSITDVTIYKYGYNTKILSRDNLKQQLHLRLWPQRSR